ncbi:TetR/AcrR family transcriptional regulator [Conexibacter stalactiti]|uniref:TetR/AcrR family transcriptional regulator n=1 Tax=Conexibacter stalactiti TaxID=1940611 RepID=A0ABU4I0P0_9ACTN|nr:TetR/AcrR family transcriptional regulator [Conexibacter stalactiti]MDW5598929.1 TetR/AcrR family transcriptional regulator [Conexibacter stalactiti]MEC5039571.1 TetR/AcrR family transcriptional regulator [Conexibacter stalactiti]
MATGQRYGGRSAEERRAERRTRLLDAGLELFGTRGYANTSIEALCAATRLNPRYFYESFASREELLQAVYDRHMQALAATVADAIAAAPLEPRARCEAALRSFVENQLADRRAARITYLEIVGVSLELERHRRGVLRGFAAMIEAEADRLAAGGQLPARDHHLTALALGGATDGLLTDCFTSEQPSATAAIVTTLVDLFVAAFTFEG